jgi:hypothetical protein
VDDNEVAAAILQPHFDAVRDVFVAYEPGVSTEVGGRVLRPRGLVKLAKTKFVIDPKIRDTRRHFAATRDDGLLMMFAPEFVDLPMDTVVAVICHEFGHAADFAYPARWLMPPDGPGCAVWIDDPDVKPARQWRTLWRQRNDLAGKRDKTKTCEHARDQIEWAADGIAEAVTGKRVGYCGDCLLQCFRGEERPAGLR